MRFQPAAIGVMVSVLLVCAAPSEDSAGVVIRKLLSGIAKKCDGAKTYSFEGDLQVSGQRGDVPGRVLSKAKVKLAVAPGGKYFLRIQAVDKDEYLLVSNGQKSWAYVPRLKQYTETEGGTIDVESDDDQDSGGGSTEERDLAETFSHLVIDVLGRMVRTAESAAPKPPVKVKYEGETYTWPVAQVLSKKSTDGQSLTEVTADPETLRIGRLMWANVI